MTKNQKQKINKNLPTTHYSPQTTHSGFTLIELLVVVTIMVLLVLFYIPQHRQFARRNELRMAAQEMKEKILQAQAYALAPQHTDINPEDEKNFPYYRFVFYPESPVKYEIRMGAVDYTGDVSTTQLADEPDPIETGYLPKNISFLGGPDEIINNINEKNEGTIIFKIPSGDCYYAWQPDRTGNREYTFKNQANETATIQINLDSCKVTTEENF